MYSLNLKSVQWEMFTVYVRTHIDNYSNNIQTFIRFRLIDKPASLHSVCRCWNNAFFSAIFRSWPSLFALVSTPTPHAAACFTPPFPPPRFPAHFHPRKECRHGNRSRGGESARRLDFYHKNITAHHPLEATHPHPISTPLQYVRVGQSAAVA